MNNSNRNQGNNNNVPNIPEHFREIIRSLQNEMDNEMDPPLEDSDSEENQMPRLENNLPNEPPLEDEELRNQVADILQRIMPPGLNIQNINIQPPSRRRRNAVVGNPLQNINMDALGDPNAMLNFMDLMSNPFETEEDRANMSICDSHMVDYIKRVRSHMSEMDGYEDFKEDFKYDSVTKLLAKMIVAYWQEKKELPNDVEKFNEVVEFCCDYQLANRPCDCLLDNLEDEEKKHDIYEIAKRHILFFGDFPGCMIMTNMLGFKLMNKRIPNMQELGDYLKHQREFHRDPEQYYQDHKHQLPTANLSLLKPTTYDNEETKTCGLCYNEIEKGTIVMKLPCRGQHVFHLKEEECLEGLTIVNWLKSNKVCPMCKDEIIINDNEENEEQPKETN